MKTQLEKINQCIDMIDEIRDIFNNPTIDSYLIGAQEGLHMAKLEVEKNLKCMRRVKK